MPRPCTCDHARCPQCTRYHQRPEFRRLWDGLPILDCAHLQPATGELVACAACGGARQVDVLGCAVHGRCTGRQIVTGLACCTGCPEWTSPLAIPDPPSVRHLLYHVCPFPGNGVWQRNVDAMLPRLGLFNGRRVVAIATGAGLDPASTVRERFGDGVAEFVEIPNDPKLREVATFAALLSRIQSDDPREVTLYAHAKGVTRPDSSPCHRWAEVLAEVCLDYWPHVARALKSFPVVGPFKKVGKGWAESTSAWHYSGSWYWFRNRDLFGRDWRRIDKFWSGIEAYPSLHFRADEAGCLFHEGPVSQLNLYSQAYWHDVVEPAYAAWRAEHAADRQECPR